jgi:hypothetical protein
MDSGYRRETSRSSERSFRADDQRELMCLNRSYILRISFGLLDTGGKQESKKGKRDLPWL